ncbi:ABC transporter substrate-binding protein [Helicobacter sp. 11S03491-1]|uniref:ABC transporter substrate-binding protein n=1 Tax=Helicobacter sp. 11S03491-1 TaxID=1476196 RepID=UPI000BA6C108|nr:ABC transporter substrate-binding protein [Helicobacter sp. 11S03491-1]PAF43438.1 hypothetical protein BKH45_02075 [Helicobacter sp. 11S03491-1]
MRFGLVFLMLFFGIEVLANEINRIVVVGGMWPLPSVITLVDNGAKKLVYIPKASINAIRESVLATFYPDILKVPYGNTQNIEEILNLKPDIVFCHASNVKLCDTIKSSGIPTIALSVNIGDYNYLLTLQDWLEKIGKVLSKEEMTNKLIKHNQEIESQIKSALKACKQIPKAMILHQYHHNEIIVDGLFANYLLKTTGARNVFSSIKANRKVNLEEIYALNPEVIFITNFTQTMPKDLLESKLWQGIDAIKNKRVYKIPLGSYRWFAPSAEFPVFLMWLAKKNHPKIFANIDIQEQLKKHFKEFYGLKLDDAGVQKILHPSPKAGILY